MDARDSIEKGCYTDHGVSGYGVAVKLQHQEPMNDVLVKAMAEEMMLSIARKCTGRGARCIGHIKSYVWSDAGTIKADTIGVAHGAFSTGCFEHPVNDLYMVVNSIVQGIPEDEVKAATLEGIHEVAEARGLSVFIASEQNQKRKICYRRSYEQWIPPDSTRD